MRVRGTAFAGISGLISSLVAGPALAQGLINVADLPRIGIPEQDGLGLQTPTTELAGDILWFDNFLLVYITVIVVLVMAAMAYVFVRFNSKSNATPATFTHNTPLEIAWTVIPAFTLVVIALFMSLPILFKQLDIPKADVTVKAIGNQWYWSYEYPDHEFGFDQIMLEREELADFGYEPDEYLFATDTVVVLPVGKNVVMQITGADVIHAWKIPSFGVHMDAVPGRLAEIWFKPEEEGLFFGQCSELCGQAHAYMPITVAVVSEDAYNSWLEDAVAEYAGDPSTLPGRVQIAAAE